MNRLLRFATARQVFDAFPTAASEIEAKPADIEPLAYLDSLLQGPTPEDGISFLAYLLPRREAVWWACHCIRAIEEPLAEADNKLLTIAEAWVESPRRPIGRERWTIGHDRSEKIGNVMTVEAGMKIELKVATSKIIIEPQGITIQAPTITIKADALLEESAPITKVTGTALLVLQGGLVKIN